MSALLKIGSELLEVVDLAVLDREDGAVFVSHRLVAMDQVDDREAPGPKDRARAGSHPLVIGTSMLEVTHPEQFRAKVDGLEVRDSDWFCADPVSQRYEFNFRLPDRVGKGPRELVVSMGKREFPPSGIEVA